MAVHLDRRQVVAGGLALSAGAALAETPSGAPWLTAEPGEAGFADDLAARLDKLIADKRVWGQHGVLVIRRGRVVLERYFDGEENNWGKVSAVRFGLTTLHNMYSVTKSIVALVYGVALGEQKVPPPEAPLYEQFPEYPDLIAADARRGELTVGHALTMTLGLAWDEIGLRYDDLRNDEIGMEHAKDRYRFILDRPIVGPPGKRWLYCGGATALLGRLVDQRHGPAIPGLRARQAVRSGRHRPDGVDRQQGHLGRGEVRPRRRRARRGVRPADDAARSRAHRPARARRRRGERPPGGAGRMAATMLRAARQRRRNPPLRIPMVRRRHAVSRPLGRRASRAVGRLPSATAGSGCSSFRSSN